MDSGDLVHLPSSHRDLTRGAPVLYPQEEQGLVYLLMFTLDELFMCVCVCMY